MQVGPAALAAMGAELAGGVEATGFSFTHDCWRGVLANGLGDRCLSFAGGLGMGKRELWRSRRDQRLDGMIQVHTDRCVIAIPDTLLWWCKAVVSEEEMS